MKSTCGAIRRDLISSAWPRSFDGPLAGARRHAEQCASCRAFLSEMQALEFGARAAAQAELAPLEVRERLFTRIAEARTHAPRRRARPFVWALSLAAAAAITAMVVRSAAVSGSGSALVTAIAQDHANALGGDRLESADGPAVEQWLAARLTFAVRVPVLEGAELTGARVCLTPRGRGAAIEYRVDGRKVSYFILPPQGDPLPVEGAFRHAHADGYRAVVWKDTDLVHAMVGALSDAALEQMARQCVKQAGSARFTALRRPTTAREADPRRV